MCWICGFSTGRNDIFSGESPEFLKVVRLSKKFLLFVTNSQQYGKWNSYVTLKVSTWISIFSFYYICVFWQKLPFKSFPFATAFSFTAVAIHLMLHQQLIHVYNLFILVYNLYVVPFLCMSMFCQCLDFFLLALFTQR